MLIIRRVKSQTPASLLTWPVTADLMSPPRVWVFGTTGAHDTSTCPVELPDRAPSPPSVGPMGRRLASLTLPEPELLRHDAALTILPCQLLWPAVSYLPFGASPLFAWLPAPHEPGEPIRGQTLFNSSASPRKPSPHSSNIWRTARTFLTPCTSENVNDSVKWELKGEKKTENTVCWKYGLPLQAGNWEKQETICRLHLQ